MAQLRSTGFGRLAKYNPGVMEILTNGFETGNPVSFGPNQHIVKNNQFNKNQLKQYVDLASLGKEKEALKLVLEIETPNRPTITFGSLSKPKVNYNFGDITEAILAVTLYTRFSCKKIINEYDVYDYLEIIDLCLGLKIRIPESSLTFLQDIKNKESLKPIILSCVKFTNILELPKGKNVSVICDGISNAATAKEDVKVICDGQLIYNFSVKYGDVKQFGQVSGFTFQKQCELWKSLLNLELDFLECVFDDSDILMSTNLVYSFISHTFNQLDLKTDLSNGINYFISRNDPTIQLVQFKSEKEIYFFDTIGISDKMKLENISSKFDTNNDFKPKVLFGDILTVRLKVESTLKGLYTRNYLEKEKGFTRLFGNKV